MNKKEKTLYYFEYSFLFILIAGIAVFYFYSAGKTMISEGGDGFRQHYRALLYYSDYLKKLFDNFLHGKFIVPQWDFAIGEGADLFLTLHLHAIGDIFAFFSVLCPDKYMYLYYDGMSLARMYCSGLFFSMYCFYMKKSKRQPVLVGALLYAFCAFSITSMYNHAYFIAAVVYLPLILLGVERVINKDKSYLLSIAVLFSSLSNFYFFFMNVVSTVLYVGFRLIFLNKGNKERAEVLIKVSLYSFIGLLMSSIVFLPMLKTMMNNSRMNAPVQFDFLYPLSTYLTYFTKMTFHGSYFGGFSFLWIISFSYLFIKDRKPVLMAVLIAAFLFANLPYLGSIYHALTYPTDRWLYAVSLVVAFVTVEALEDYDGINSILPVVLLLVVVYYGACVFLDPDSKMIHIAFCAFTITILLLMRVFKNIKMRNLVIVASIFVFYAAQMFYIFGPNYWNYVRSGTSIEDIAKMTVGEYSVFDEIQDNEFFRYSGYRLTENANIHGDFSNTQHYWSIINNNIVDFRKQLAYSDNSLHHINNYGERFSQNALSCVKYYINDEEDYIPYGFYYLDTINGHKIYKSDYALPLLYAYDNYLTKEEWNAMDPVQKNETLVQAAVVDETPANIEKRAFRLDETEVSYQMRTGQGISVDEHNINAHGDDGFIYLDVDHHQDGEYYVVVEGLYSNKLTAYIRINYNDIEKTFVFKGTDNQHYTDRHDYLVNLGYLDGVNGTISIDFSDGGEYTYDSISLICQPLDYQISSLNHLKDININRLDIDANTVRATIHIDENKLICFAVPYSEGWKAYVDGNKAKILECNIQYMALELSPGDHTIELRYSTPLAKEGMLLSFAGVALLLFFMAKERKYIKDHPGRSH